MVAPAPLFRQLSPRMEQVIRMVIDQDKSYREVAGELEISERTVRNYAYQIGTRIGRKPKAAMAWYFYSVMADAGHSTNVT